MATGFDSFNRSDLGAFIESALGARGGVVLEPWLMGPHNNITVSMTRGAFVMQDADGLESVTKWRCGGYAPGGTVYVNHGRMRQYEWSSGAGAGELATTHNPETDTTPLYTAQLLSGFAIVRENSVGLGGEIQPLHMPEGKLFITRVEYPDPSTATLASSCVSTWYPSDPPPFSTYYGFGWQMNCYDIYTRAEMGDDFARYDATRRQIDGVYSYAYLNESTADVWGKQSTSPHFQIHSVYDDPQTASMTNITLPSSDTPNALTQVILFDVDGMAIIRGATYNLYVYTAAGAFVQTIAMPSSGTNTWDMRNDWLVFYNSGTGLIYWYKKSGGSYSLHSSVSGSECPRVCSATTAVGASGAKYVYSGGAWSSQTFSAADDLIADGYHLERWLSDAALFHKTDGGDEWYALAEL